MISNKVTLILWVVFGFLFITAVDSILYFIVHLIYFAKAEFGLSYKFMIVSMPVATLFLYILTSFFIIKKINSNRGLKSINQINPPKAGTFTILFVIAIVLPVVTNKLSGLHIEYSDWEVLDSSDILAVHGWMSFGIAISRWIIIGSLILIYVNKRKIC